MYQPIIKNIFVFFKKALSLHGKILKLWQKTNLAEPKLVLQKLCMQ